MYKFKKEIDQEELLKGRSKTYIAKQIGISLTQLANIMSGYSNTKKTTAYCITKMLDNNLEISDLFDRVN